MTTGGVRDTSKRSLADYTRYRKTHFSKAKCAPDCPYCSRARKVKMEHEETSQLVAGIENWASFIEGDDLTESSKYKVGFKWHSVDGEREIAAHQEFGKLGKVFLVTRPKAGGHEIFKTVDELKDRIEWDAKHLASAEKSAALAAKKEADRIAALDHDFEEFIKTLSPAMGARARKALEKQRGLSGKFLPLKDHIKTKVEKGYKVGSTKAHGDVFEGPDGSFYLQRDITKVGMNYVRFLLDRK